MQRAVLRRIGCCWGRLNSLGRELVVICEILVSCVFLEILKSEFLKLMGLEFLEFMEFLESSELELKFVDFLKSTWSELKLVDFLELKLGLDILESLEFLEFTWAMKYALLMMKNICSIFLISDSDKPRYKSFCIIILLYIKLLI